MATAAATTRAFPAIPGRRYDKIFFSGMALLMLAIVLIGFGKSYFLAGVVRAHLPSWIIHVHAVMFSAWALLFVTQTSLVARGNLAMHRKLGLWGFGLACAMVVVGVVAATNALGRGLAPFGLDAQTFYTIPIFAMANFSVLVAFGYRNRTNATAHKRLLLLATIGLMGAPTARVPFDVITGRPHLAGVFVWILISLLGVYDVWALHKVHVASVLGGLALIATDQLAIPFGFTPAWHAFARFMLHLSGH
jgi:hypothetical protein